MHTDEAWLADLSRAIMDSGSLSATESFFNLVHREPHALKTFFHIFQIIFTQIEGFSLFSVRLLSLICGTATLAVFAGLLRRLNQESIPVTILLSVEIQFIYASHFARQEIQILLMMLITLYLLLDTGTQGFRRGLIAGIPIAAAIGFHPNAFIAAWPAGLFLLAEVLRRKRTPSEGAGYIVAPALSAIFFIILSFALNRDFVSDYSSFGAETGVMESPLQKLLGFDDFYRKLFMRISGTYYTPEIRPEFIIAAASGIILLLRGFSGNRSHSVDEYSRMTAQMAAAGIIGVNAGIIIIGKYSAPSIVLVMPFLIIITAAAAESFEKSIYRRLLYAAAAAVLLANSAMMIFEDKPYKNETYADFTAEIESAIPELTEDSNAAEHRVLGPLTAGFALEYGRLLDWRNLALLKDAGITLEEYIAENNIEYIIYTAEIDVIYGSRPVWNILYGNPFVYYEQLQQFLNNRCVKVADFPSPGYGTRIVMHRFKKDWMVRVFRVK